MRMLCNGVLETLGSIKMGKNPICTAHPHVDLETNESFLFGYGLFCLIPSYIISAFY